MKKNHAFFHPRALSCLLILSTGVFLALVGFGQSQRASTQVGSISAQSVDNLSLDTPAGGPQPCAPPPSGMEAWWPGDGNATDIQGGHNGTLQGGATFASGEVDQGFSVNGTSAYISIPDSPDLYPSGSFTVDAWIKTSQTTGLQTIITHYECANNCTGNDNSLWLLYLDNGELAGQIRDTTGANQVLTGTTMIADGTFHHVALQRDTSGNQMLLYLDGAIETSAALVVTGVLHDDDGEADPVTIGAIIENSNVGCGCPVNFFSGVIDEVEYFNRSLSQPEIQSIVNAGSSGKCKARARPTPRPRPTPVPRPTS